VCGHRSRTLAFLIKKFGTASEFVEYRDVYAFDKAKIVTAEKLVIETTLSLPEDFKLLVDAPLYDPDVRDMISYLASRGLEQDEHRWARRVIMPSFDDAGLLNYFTARAIDKKRNPKYDNADVEWGSIIFNEINIDWKQELVLCEGPFDLMKCPNNSAPMLGSNMSDTNELLNMIRTNKTPVALALDADMWETKTIRLAKKLSSYDIGVRIIDTRPFGDPGDATKKQFALAHKNAKVANWDSMFQTKLDRASRTSMRI
jgi:hypothetical protein